jgi:murein DD-endopeptidase MepM/ murein hydrolase activator NlpD
LIFNRKKYHFNPVTLSYEEIKKNKGFGVLKYSALLLSFLTLAFISGYLLNEEFGSGETRKLEAQVDSLTVQFHELYERGEQYSVTLQSDIFTADNTYRMILGLDTLPYPMRNAGRGGSAAYYENMQRGNLQYRLSDLITSLTDQLKIQSNSFSTLYDKALSYSTAKSHMPAIQPVAMNDLLLIASEFGLRKDPFISIEKHHHGLDFVTPTGKNVYATGDGTVTFAKYSRNGYGNEILIDHGFGFGSRYAHLGSMKVQEGQKVKRGQIIGTVGATGRATGPHLHYEVLYNSQPVNPSYYFDTTLTGEEFAQIIKEANGIN